MGGRMRIDDFMDATLAATRSDQVLTVFQSAVADLGFDRMMYSALQVHPQSQDICIAGSYPTTWISHYEAQGYKDIDPLRRYGGQHRAAFSWADLARRYRYSRAERTVMSEAREAGLNDGIAIPLHGPAGELMGVSLASSAPHPEAPRHLPEAYLLTVQFHTRHELLSDSLTDGALVTLTNREREVLQWAARGKSNWVIGEILNISEHGVDFHLRNILRKLEADSRITAVVKALTMGLIAL